MIGRSDSFTVFVKSVPDSAKFDVCLDEAGQEGEARRATLSGGSASGGGARTKATRRLSRRLLLLLLLLLLLNSDSKSVERIGRVARVDGTACSSTSGRP